MPMIGNKLATVEAGVVSKTVLGGLFRRRAGLDCVLAILLSTADEAVTPAPDRLRAP